MPLHIGARTPQIEKTSASMPRMKQSTHNWLLFVTLALAREHRRQPLANPLLLLLIEQELKIGQEVKILRAQRESPRVGSDAKPPVGSAVQRPSHQLCCARQLNWPTAPTRPPHCQCADLRQPGKHRVRATPACRHDRLAGCRGPAPPAQSDLQPVATHQLREPWQTSAEAGKPQQRPANLGNPLPASSPIWATSQAPERLTKRQPAQCQLTTSLAATRRGLWASLCSNSSMPAQHLLNASSAPPSCQLGAPAQHQLNAGSTTAQHLLHIRRSHVDARFVPAQHHLDTNSVPTQRKLTTNPAPVQCHIIVTLMPG